MKKMLLKAYLAENLGDDLFLKIILERYSNVQWYILTENTKYLNNFLRNYSNVKIIKIPKIMMNLKGRLAFGRKLYIHLIHNANFDGLVEIGGSIFMEHKNWNLLYKERRDLWMKFHNNGKKVFILGSNFGAYAQEKFLKVYKELFNKLDDLCVRDEYSFNLLQEVSNIRKAPDIVYALEINSKNIQKKSVGISVISLSNRTNLQIYENNYINKMTEIIDVLTNSGYKVTLFSFCQLEGDENMIEKIIAQCNDITKASVEKHFYDGNLEQTLQEISSMESIISCRFHSLILAYVLNKPVFPIIYSKKTSDVILDLKIKQNMVKIEDIDKIDIEQVFESLSQSPNISNETFKSAKEHFARLDDFLKE